MLFLDASLRFGGLALLLFIAILGWSHRKSWPGAPYLALACISGADAILDTLGIAMLKYPADEARVRWELNPWIVQDALSRLGHKQLTQSEQREVWNATRTLHKVQWPEWWSYNDE